MNLGIGGKTALVCAASKGLGRGCAFALAREGCAVTIVARTPGPLEETAAAIREATGARVTAVAGDHHHRGGPRRRARSLPRARHPDQQRRRAPPGQFRDWERADWIAAPRRQHADPDPAH